MKQLEAVSRSFWKRLWEEDGDIVTTEGKQNRVYTHLYSRLLLKISNQNQWLLFVSGFIHVFKMAGVTDESSQQQLIKAAASDEIKHALTKNTEEVNCTFSFYSVVLQSDLLSDLLLVVHCSVLGCFTRCIWCSILRC